MASITPSIHQEAIIQDKIVLSQSTTSNENRDYNKEPGISLEPESSLFQHGQAYSSLEVFKYIADQYARTNGFKMILYKGNNRSDGVRSIQVFACDCYGLFKPKSKDPNKKNRNVESKKCNCPWFIHLNHNRNDDIYYILQAILHHNHLLIPVQLMRISSANREIP
ncbi:3657_t:CDS:2, partial [Ambispora gerdemannii]